MFTIVSRLPFSPITYFPNQSLIPNCTVSNPEFYSALPNLIILALLSVDVQVFFSLCLKCPFCYEWLTIL